MFGVCNPLSSCVNVWASLMEYSDLGYDKARETKMEFLDMSKDVLG